MTRNSLRARFSLGLVCLLLLIPCGCGKSGVKLYSVQGKVFNGTTQLKAGAVTFYPDASKGNTRKEPVVGHIKDGIYTLTTDGKDGAPVGWYKVTISTNMPPGMDGKQPEVVKMNSIYGDVSKTDLSIEVVESPKDEQYDLKLKP